MSLLLVPSRLPWNSSSAANAVCDLQFEDSLDENVKLVESIEINTKHYVELMSRAIDKLLPTPTVDIK